MGKITNEAKDLFKIRKLIEYNEEENTFFDTN